MDVSLFLVCVKSVVRTAALHRMPSADFGVFEVILPFGNIGVLESLPFNLSVQVYLSKQIALFSLNKVPAAACWGLRGGIIFRNTYSLFPTVTYTLAIPLLYP